MRLNFYGRRHGKKIKPNRMEILNQTMSQLEIKRPEEATDLLPPQNLFEDKNHPVFLEIGFGGGEHLAYQAFKNPDINFIGAEPFINGVASLCAHITDEITHEVKFKNIRIFPDDIRILFPFFPNECLDKIFVLYPDPWPKARHENRRILNGDNLKQLHRLLKKGHILQVATDVEDYANWAIEQVQSGGLFKQINPSVHTPPVDWVSTRYEQKGLRAGRTPFYFLFEKI